jgi:hypothetical protein
MENIINIINVLNAQTADFKAVYVEKCITYALNDYNRQVFILTWSDEQWCEFFGITPRIETFERTATTRLTFPNGFYNTANAKIRHNMINKARKVRNYRQEDYLSYAKGDAEHHYKVSVEKLAHRIISKGLNYDTLTVTAGWVNVNFNCVITDGEKTVKASTIIAEGPVQRPHYRYLIK